MAIICMVYGSYEICAYNIITLITLGFHVGEKNVLYLEVQKCGGLDSSKPTIKIYQKTWEA